MTGLRKVFRYVYNVSDNFYVCACVCMCVCARAHLCVKIKADFSTRPCIR